MQQIIFATHNQHKTEELRQMLGDRYHVVSLHDIGWDTPIDEPEPTLQGNASVKARAVAERYPGAMCLADDTGLEVDALGGEPGVRSARFAGDECDSNRNVELLLSRLYGVTDRSAHFRTVMALIDSDGREHLFEGRVDGEIIEERHGQGGFGYDPVFRPEGWNCTFAEATPEQKNAVSHRGRAVAAVVEWLNNTDNKSTL